MMQQQHYISYSRGMIRVLNRAALRSLSCECYQVGQDDYRRLLGEPPADLAMRLSAEQGTP